MNPLTAAELDLLQEFCSVTDGTREFLQRLVEERDRLQQRCVHLTQLTSEDPVELAKTLSCAITAIDLQNVIASLCASFPDDKSQPSVVLSKLKDGRWYGSLVRYAEAMGKGKQVLANCAEDTFTGVVLHLLTLLGGDDAKDSH